MPALVLDATESAGLERPLDSEARLLAEGVGRSMGVDVIRGDSLKVGVDVGGSPFAPIRGVT